MSTRREFLTQAEVASVMASGAAAPVAAAESKAAPATATTGKPAGPMKTYTIPHTDLVVSRLAYGNAMIGSDWNSPDFIAQTVPVIRAAYEQGGATKAEHVIDNCTADRIELSRTEWYSLLRAAAPIEEHT